MEKLGLRCDVKQPGGGFRHQVNTCGGQDYARNGGWEKWPDLGSTFEAVMDTFADGLDAGNEERWEVGANAQRLMVPFIWKG